MSSGDPPQGDVAIRLYFAGSDSPGSSGASADADGSSTPASTSASDENIDSVGDKLKLLALHLLDKWKDLKVRWDLFLRVKILHSSRV